MAQKYNLGQVRYSSGHTPLSAWTSAGTPPCFWGIRPTTPVFLSSPCGPSPESWSHVTFTHRRRVEATTAPKTPSNSGHHTSPLTPSSTSGGSPESERSLLAL